jgi:hypothetical protein
MWYNYYMPTFQTTKIWKSTLAKLRLIAALNDERIVSVVDRLATAELARLQRKGKA